MLRDIATFPRIDTRVWLWLDGAAAWCPDTGAQLRASRGRRRSGRPSHWFVSLPEGAWIDYANRTGIADDPPGVQMRLTFRVTAYTLDEAIEAANARLAQERAKAAG